MILFRGIEDMPIYNFDKVLKTSNMSYLIVGWNERDVIEWNEDNTKQVNEGWNIIYNEYCAKTENNEALTYYALVTELSYLETRFSIVVTLIESMSESTKESFGRELNAWGIVFNIKGKIDAQLDDLSRQLRAAKQKIDIRRAKVESMKSDESNSSLIKQNIKLKRITELEIDVRKTTVEEWIELHNEAKEIIELSKKNNG